MKTIIAGSRSLADYKSFLLCMKDFNNAWDISEIVSGGAQGIDELGKRYAEENEIPCKIFPANWDLYGKKAGYLRNRQMGKYADALIAIWDGESKGTLHMINIAQELDLTVFQLTIAKR